ncbi:MAG: hypothetical protein AOA66_1151 [Candidatus Bathyarchaeota archaeon BA2]|nr:MAG: hypothetical protein AOA66_1151 [Candidatus Bathyarchaeota archaeon BA2]
MVYRKPRVMVINPKWMRSAGKRDAEFFAEKVNAAFIWDINLENLLKAIDEAKKKKAPVFANGVEKLAEVILEF